MLCCTVTVYCEALVLYAFLKGIVTTIFLFRLERNFKLVFFVSGGGEVYKETGFRFESRAAGDRKVDAFLTECSWNLSRYTKCLHLSWRCNRICSAGGQHPESNSMKQFLLYTESVLTESYNFNKL